MSITFPKRTQNFEQLEIVKSGLAYTLPVGWAITDAGSYEFRNSLEDRAYAHGSDMVGDGKVDGRTIKIEFDMSGTTEEEHDEILNMAYTYFTMTDYDLRVGRGDRVYHVAAPQKISQEFRDGFKQRWSKVTATLLLADPFRYEAQESKVVKIFDEYTYRGEIVLHNLGSVDTPLTFHFLPMESLGIATVWHQEEAAEFRLSDTLLAYPLEGIVNGKEGTVWRNDANNINAFSGQFLHANPGSNLYLYTGGAARIEITYTNRWYV